MRRKQCIQAVLVLFIMLLPAAAAAANGVIAIPRTGQTACYDLNGAVIECKLTGQDGDMLAGATWPSIRFIDNGDGTVTDNLTGLMWTQDANLGGSYRSWSEALEYIKTLTVGGYTDWRLPNIHELDSLTDSGAVDPALPHGHPFINVLQNFYWTSTSVAFDTLNAWVVDMSDGGIGSAYKPNIGQYIWPVRKAQPGKIELPRTGQDACYDTGNNVISCTGTGQDGDEQAGAAWPASRLQNNGDGTVTDLLTGLMWTQDANPAGTPMTWQEALDYASNVTVGGYADWRLPNRKELRSLVDYSRNYPPLSQGPPFVNAPDFMYWSSTSYAGIFVHNFAWTAGMAGFVYPDTKPNTYCVWPVRAGLVDNDTDNGTSLKVIPKKIHRLVSFINPIHVFILVGPKDHVFQRGFRVHWGSDAVKTLLRVKIGKRIIIALAFVNPFKLEAGDCGVNVGYCKGSIEIKRF